MKAYFTEREKKHARQMLLEIANCYEIKKRKHLNGVFFDESGARWIGQAHDYSFGMVESTNWVL